MLKAFSHAHKGINWKVISIMLAVLAVFALFFLVASAAPATPRAQAELLDFVSQQPDSDVNVIIQKTIKDKSIEDLAVKLGGTITKDLHIINAFAAQLPAQAIQPLALAEGVRWISMDAPVERSGEPSSAITNWATSVGKAVAKNGFTKSAAMVDSALGAKKTYGYGGNVKGSFTGIQVEVTPGNAISKVQIALRSYVLVPLDKGENPKITVYVGGKPLKAVTVSNTVFNANRGVDKAGTVYVDVTSLRKWKWSDLQGIEVAIDQSALKTGHVIFYDAIGVRVTSMPGKDVSSLSDPKVASARPRLAAASTPKPISLNNLISAYDQAVNAPQVWNEGPKYLQGQGVTVAVVDSGIIQTPDLNGRLIGNVNFSRGYNDASDLYGHGTFVASILAGDGDNTNGQYIGIAPRANVVNVRISNDNGVSYESDVVESLQWVSDWRQNLNIRVVNLSMNSSASQSYQTSPLDAACEIMWFNGIVVVVSAGNNGTATLYPPANDPFVITVGAADDKGTPNISDDGIGKFSAWGTTQDGFTKPDIVAPGTNITAALPDNGLTKLGKNHPNNRINATYFKMSGTSMSAPVVAGAAVLLLQDEPNLNPDQVKYRLLSTTNKNFPGYDTGKAGAGYLDIYAAIHGTSSEVSNKGQIISNLLMTGSDPIDFSSVSWSSVSWSSVSWSSVSWSSVSWSSVSWSSDYFEPGQ